MSVRSLLPIIVVAVGFYILFCLRFCFVLHPFHATKMTVSALKSPDSKKALALSLAGTLGVGNIVGVAVGISVGGAGSVLWLLVSSVFASVLKYSEAALTSSELDGGGRGMIDVIRKSFNGAGRALSVSYAFLCLLLAFFMGAALQSASASSCVGEIVGKGKAPFSLIFAFLSAIVVIKGKGRIERVVSVVIPIITVLYICLAFSSIVANYARIPHVIYEILTSAFTAESACGGILGFFASSKIREGFSRGLLSNEAGAGTSSLAHAENKTADPVSAGLVGMLEVIFDTVILCLLSALSVLVCIPEPSAYTSGVALIMESVGGVFGLGSGVAVCVSIILFAFSTVICWYYYGSECYRYLFPKRGVYLYFTAFIAAVLIGSFFEVGFLVVASDYVLLFLTVICTSAVIKNSDRLRCLSEEFGLIKSPRRSRGRIPEPPRKYSRVDQHTRR